MMGRWITTKVGILVGVCGYCTSLQYLHDGYDAHASATSLAAIFRCVFPMGKVRSSSQNSIVEGSPVVHPGIPGTIVAIETPNARIAAIVRSAESQKAAKAGAEEIRLQVEFPTCVCKITTFP